MKSKIIFHIIEKEVWEINKNIDLYRPDSLKNEGFIHCSKFDQILGVANHFFSGQSNLLLLVIESGKVDSDILYEDAGNMNFFPHIYGPLNLSSVVDVIDFQPDANDVFKLSEKIKKYQ